MSRVILVLIFSFILFLAVFLAQGTFAQALIGQSFFSPSGGPGQVDSLALNVGGASDDTTLGLKAGYLMGSYQLGLNYRTIDLEHNNWPQKLVQSNISVGRVFETDNGRMLMVNLGVGASSERTNNAYSYAEPTGQIMYMAPPEQNASWGYGAGLMMLSNSPIGRFPTPMLMAIYTNGENFKMTVGLPMISMSYVFGDDNSLDLVAAPFGIQRIAVKREFSAAFRSSLVYKQDRAFFNHVEGWSDDHLFNYTSEKTGVELEYECSNSIKVGIEGGYLIKRNLKKVESGFNGSTINGEEIRGGSYLQLVNSFSF